MAGREPDTVEPGVLVERVAKGGSEVSCLRREVSSSCALCWAHKGPGIQDLTSAAFSCVGLCSIGAAWFIKIGAGWGQGTFGFFDLEAECFLVQPLFVKPSLP